MSHQQIRSVVQNLTPRQCWLLHIRYSKRKDSSNLSISEEHDRDHRHDQFYGQVGNASWANQKQNEPRQKREGVRCGQTG